MPQDCTAVASIDDMQPVVDAASAGGTACMRFDGTGGEMCASVFSLWFFPSISLTNDIPPLHVSVMTPCARQASCLLTPLLSW